MTNFGRNLKITVDEAHRELTRRVFEDALGCKIVSSTDALEVYGFEEGCGLGAFFVEASDALPAAELKKGPWLEFCVDDPVAVEARLAKIGVLPFAYTDTTHSYFCPLGGPVFRLAKKS